MRIKQNYFFVYRLTFSKRFEQVGEDRVGYNKKASWKGGFSLGH
ncbi:hypothetical protein [Segetibacter aerophilus]|nr:hypothetical protein [Segetibacter aerophilus]